ncbi:MAG: DNA-3-methyladenine glycosylase 2 [Chlorobium sp.]|nr:MAG: DNA-3-methyladenine glycosylase 2 [Chlorobium sp.]
MDLYSHIIKLKSAVDVKESLFSGQSFLWDNYENRNDYYMTVIKRIPIIIRQLTDNKVEVISDSITVDSILISDFINNYFSVNVDINKIYAENFMELYPDIYSMLNGYYSLRILRQEPFETMISFMCAQGIGMHIIRKQVSMLKKFYGEKFSITFNGDEIILYSFPTPQQLANADLSQLSLCTNNNKLRAANIILAAKSVVEGKLDLNILGASEIPLAQLRNTLCQIRGIGFKIADCIALFGLGRFDAFPIDTHVKQYLGTWFKSTTALRSLTPANYLILDAEARTFLNPDFAGYAGHILFHCWRKEIKKLHSF